MSELALKLIAENKKTRATFLDLGNCGLTEVPNEIGELVWLEGLSFVETWFVRVDEKWEREKSQNTGIANNIKRLLPITSIFLDIFGNQTQTKKNPFSHLKNLRDLWLTGDYYGNAKLNDITPLSVLVNLQLLYISRTKVTNLSPLKELKSLQILGLSNTPVSDLTPLAHLKNLIILDISSTKILNLEPLTGLINLRKLFLSKTKVSNLTPLSGLYRLEELDLEETLVSELTPLINLNTLNFLDLERTEVNDIAALLPFIQKGTYVHVFNNRMTREIKLNDLPSRLQRSIYHSSVIKISAEKLTNPPVTIVEQGNAAILNYFKEKQQQGTDHLYEAKLLIVGAGGAGKTSLMRRLYQPKQPLPDEDQTTKGIDIYPHKFNVQDNRYPNWREFRLNVWDFGGQEIYHATHQFFLTQRSLYVLLDDTRTNDKTVHDPSFKYWLDVVDLLSNHSPLLIFQNEKGGRGKAIDLAGIKAKFCSVKDCYSGNLEHMTAADGVRDAIEYYAKHLPHIGEELPKQWIPIRAEIEQAAKQQPTISQQDYFKLYENHLPFDREKALHLSQYLHDLGVFLHFQDDKLLKRIVILQNHWATEAVFKILDDETVKNQHGRFTEEDCERLWQNSDYAEMHPELLALMEKFELCYLLQDSNPKTWLAPQLLPPSKPTELNDWAKAGDLVLRCRYEFLPKGMINRLMVRKHYYVPRPELAWLTGVLFERNSTQVLVELSAQGNEIVFRARGIERKDLLGAIAFELEALNSTFKGLPEKVTVLIPCCCDTCAKQAEPKFFEQADLLRRKELGKATIECPASFDNVNVLRLLDGIQTKKLTNWSKEHNMKKIFISYSKSDNQHKDKLLKFLAPLRDNDKIATWHDSDIQAGEEWDERIKQELNAADIVLYLVSVDSLATAYIQKVELPLIEQRCRAKECKLVPVIVDFCDWEESWVARYNALPAKGVAITDKQWTNENQAWLDVIKGIKNIIEPT